MNLLKVKLTIQSNKIVNIEELNVNDYALFIDGYVQITSIENCGYCNSRVYIKHQDGDIWPTHPSNLEPITLTTEILKKNGFKLASDGWLWLQDDGNAYQNYICIKFRHNGEVRDVELSFINKCQCLYKDIYYVHQFQHALRLCGINKEIVI